MVVNFVNMLAKAFSSDNVKSSTSVTRVSSNNPFAVQPTFQNRYSYTSYAKNQPVQGGYFAGYYNGKANIVGRRLFVEA